MGITRIGAAESSGDPGYLDGLVPKMAPWLAPAVTISSSSTTAYAFGAWVQLVASLSAPSALVGLWLNPNINWLDNGVHIELGRGASGAEVTVAQLGFHGNYSSDVGWFNGWVPLAKPVRVESGQRVAIRVADPYTTAMSGAARIIYYPLA